MPDARWGDPREYADRDRDDERSRVYDERDRNDHDPRDGLMRDLDLPRGEERELVVNRDRVYELNGEDSRTLAALGTFRVVPEQDLDTDHDTLDHLRDEGLVETVDLGDDERGVVLTTDDARSYSESSGRRKRREVVSRSAFPKICGWQGRNSVSTSAIYSSLLRRSNTT